MLIYGFRSYKIRGSCYWGNISRYHSFRWVWRWIWTSLCIYEAILNGYMLAIMGVIGCSYVVLTVNEA